MRSSSLAPAPKIAAVDHSTTPTPQSNTPSQRTTPPVGRVSAFVGSRLLTIALVAGVLGSALLVFTGIELWLVVARGRLGPGIIPLVVGGSLAFALLSIAGSASKTGTKYLQGHKSVARDVGRFVGRRIERRRMPRGG
jgi:hypothetical protein